MANKRKRYEEKAPPHAPFDAVERRRAPGRWVACLAPFDKEARRQHPLSESALFELAPQDDSPYSGVPGSPNRRQTARSI